MNNNDNNLKSKILSEITSGNVDMRPKAHFVLKSTLWILGIALVTGFALYVASFVVFMLRLNGVLFLPLLGAPGIREFFFALPWILILLVVLLIVVLELLGRHFAFVYRQPLMYSVVGILGVVVITGGVLAHTPLHQRALDLSKEYRLPFGGELYRHYGEKPLRDHIVAGSIIQIQENVLVISDKEGEEHIILLNENTRMPPNISFTAGDEILVITEEEAENEVTALGIRPLPKDGLRRGFGKPPRGSEKPPKERF